MPTCDAPGALADRAITPDASRAIRTCMGPSGFVVARSASYTSPVDCSLVTRVA